MQDRINRYIPTSCVPAILKNMEAVLFSGTVAGMISRNLSS